MASVSVFCIICAASLHKTGNRRQLFSASSQPLVPLLTTYASLSHGPHLILHKCNQGTDYYKYGLGVLYPLPQKVKGLGKKAVAKAFATACRQRYKNVMTSKKMFHCQLLVWSQLAVSEGFGGITYCLADSNFGVSHGSVS